MSLAGDDKQEEVQAASTAEEMWKAIGKDSWVVVPIASTSRPGLPRCASTALARPSHQNDNDSNNRFQVYRCMLARYLSGICKLVVNASFDRDIM